MLVQPVTLHVYFWQRRWMPFWICVAWTVGSFMRAASIRTGECVCCGKMPFVASLRKMPGMRMQDDDAHLRAVGGAGVLNREAEGWQDRLQRMEEWLDRMEGTAQDHEQLLIAHSVSIDAQRNHLPDVIEFLVESEVGDRNCMMDLLRHQCGVTSSVASQWQTGSRMCWIGPCSTPCG